MNVSSAYLDCQSQNFNVVYYNECHSIWKSEGMYDELPDPKKRNKK
jgi:hypothetical protein